jgi:tetratricopeptide (TPR) repeat protein
MVRDDIEAAPAEGEGGGSEPPTRTRFTKRFKWAAAVAAAALLLVLVLAYRSHQERRIVAASVARAEQLIRSDTWLGYQEAATLLGLRAARVDRLGAGSLRAFALAMLAADYRDEASADAARAVIGEAERAERVPPQAELAAAALALSAGEAGTAMTRTSRAGDLPWAHVIGARVALAASKPDLASQEIERALAQDPDLPAALALHGDLLRRAGKAAEADAAYRAALAASSRALAAGMAGSTTRPGATAPEPRATYGLAKLALSRDGDPAEATRALARLLDDRAGTPQVERVRAALHLAALLGRAGDRVGSAAAIDKAALDGSLRAWLEKAAGEEEVERGKYRVVETPPPLASASDDDPYVPPPPPPRAAERPRQVLHGFKVHNGPRKASSPKRAKPRAKVKKRRAGR